MNKQITLLFSQYFPFKGGEQFLFNEAEYFPGSSEIIVYSQYADTLPAIILPTHIKTGRFNFDKQPAVRKIIFSYWWLIFEVFLTEIYYSPHRFKYIRHFKTHFFLLVGYLQKAVTINNQLPEAATLKLYSYWFDEWATIIHLVKRISKKHLNIVCRIHGYDFDEAQVGKGYHLFRCFDLKGFDKVISVSEYGKRYVEKRYHLGRLEVSKLGVKDKGNNPLNNQSFKTIVSCSALIPLKRVHLIICLLKEMKTKITWVHFGNGPLEGQILEDAASLPSNVKFDYRAQVDNTEIMSFYKENTVDLFINLSELEGIPVSLMEAISFGIPVVGCNICGVPEIVNDQTGLLLEKDFDISKSADRIENFLTDKSTDNIYRKGVKEFWKNNFNANFNYPDFISKYLMN